jgi:hypothetical protein
VLSGVHRTARSRRTILKTFRLGSDLATLDPQLHAGPQDTFVIKRKASAFLGTSLAAEGRHQAALFDMGNKYADLASTEDVPAYVQELPKT